MGTVARELDLTEAALRSRVRQAEIDRGGGPAGALTTEEREELGRLRRENRTLRMERDILPHTSDWQRAVPLPLPDRAPKMAGPVEARPVINDLFMRHTTALDAAVA